MNRDILFKAKRIDNGEWVEGNYAKVSWWIGLGEESTDTITPINAEKVSKNQPVISETVCQYTGKTDKNGVKIFEHDIVNTEIGNFEVYFDEDLLGYALYDGGRKTTLATTLKLAVIGNIFDNPELLEGMQ